VTAIVAGALLGLGVLVELVAVLGVAVMRDPFDRVHYVGLVGYGALLVGASILVRESFSLIGDKAIVTGLLLALFSPVVGHVTARSLRRRSLGRRS
jgi:multisubunit Na+/H+ antiporter MnhG subunit